MEMRTFVLLLLLCLCISPSFADLRLPTSARFPQAQAERLIKELNLIPGIAEPEEEYDVGPRLVERSINLDINGDSEKIAGLEELGHHAGYYRLEHTHAAKMFYFFFESRGSKADDPVVLWMTGGPGCSSELAVFYENGPFKITDNLTLVWNEYGWDKASNLIFVDQPTGTGFSYSTDVRDLRHDEKGVGNDMYDFLQAFFKEHPEYAKNDFFITGESYAGHYIPAVTSRVHQGNKDNEGLPINLKGFAIGNGLTDPAIQYKAYTDYALEMGIIGEDDYNRINKIYPACELSIKLCGELVLNHLMLTLYGKLGLSCSCFCYIPEWAFFEVVMPDWENHSWINVASELSIILVLRALNTYPLWKTSLLMWFLKYSMYFLSCLCKRLP